MCPHVAQGAYARLENLPQMCSSTTEPMKSSDDTSTTVGPLNRTREEKTEGRGEKGENDGQSQRVRKNIRAAGHRQGKGEEMLDRHGADCMEGATSTRRPFDNFTHAYPRGVMECGQTVWCGNVHAEAWGLVGRVEPQDTGR